MICCFTGHRPEKLPWGREESDPRCAALKQRLIQSIRHQITQGVDTFICGMARGCDFYFAEAVLELRGEGAPIRLEAMLPCPEQPSRWPVEDAARYEQILLDCDAVYLTEARYSEGCMLRRNRAMIDRSHRMISVWDGSRGGTGSAVRYAKQKGLVIDSLWL